MASGPGAGQADRRADTARQFKEENEVRRIKPDRTGEGFWTAGMAQIWIEIEENPNCGYLPLRTYSSNGEEESAASALISYDEGGELTEVTGWSPENDGSPCDVHWVRVGDSGEGESVLVYGGDWGVRIRPYPARTEWSMTAPDQTGEPYLLLAPDVIVRPAG